MVEPEAFDQVEEDVEAGIAVTDDLFLMEGVDPTTTQLRSPLSTFSDEERDDSELDEGIHIPSKFSNKKTFEVTFYINGICNLKHKLNLAEIH